MADIAVSKIGPNIEQKEPQMAISEFRPAVKMAPTYLISVEGGKKSSTNFIGVRVDENTMCVKMIGFFSNESVEEIRKSFATLVQNTDKSQFVEMSMPWHRIISIQSLTYRHK